MAALVATFGIYVLGSLLYVRVFFFIHLSPIADLCSNVGRPLAFGLFDASVLAHRAQLHQRAQRLRLLQLVSLPHLPCVQTCY